MTVPLVTQQTGSSLQRLAEAATERTGGGSVMLFEDQRWIGVQLAERARRLSGGLRAAGLGPGERVVVCMANCPEVSITYSAVWRAGAVTTPVIFLLSADELHHVLADSGATFVVTTPDFLPKVADAAHGVDTMRAIILVGAAPAGDVPSDQPVLDFAELEAHEEGSLVDTASTDLAALLYTGGTTGRSKGVMLSHDAMSAAAWAATAMSYQEDIRTSLLPLPLSHVFGLMINVMGLHAPTPGTAVVMRWFKAEGWLRLVEQERVQVASVVPSMLQLLLAQPLEEHALSSLVRIASGGAPLSREVADAFTQRVPGASISEGYGCTETAALISNSLQGHGRPGSVGVPAPGIELRIEASDEVPDAGPGIDGEICVRGPMLLSGYWHSPEETAVAVRDGWLHTGDVGHLDEDGYLYVVDRIKDLIIRGGFNVYPSDVEDAMLGHPEVVACAVVGRPDRTYGEEVVAFVQLRRDATTSVEELVAHGREHVAANKYPREVRIVDAVPLTSVGKTDRKALRRTLLPA